MKGYLGQLEIGIVLTQNPVISDLSTSYDEFSWLKALRWCPRELLDLVNSKACRGTDHSIRFCSILIKFPGAIMFNDTLSILQCENLVKGLSETAFPFQCAHGRYVQAFKRTDRIPLIALQAVLSAIGKHRDPFWPRDEAIV